MGTDINIFAEVRRNGIWHLAEPLMKNAMWTIDAPELGPEWKPRELYTTRNAELFAILANVNNPIRSVTPFEYISAPRGFPPDASLELQRWHQHWSADAVAASWLSMEELCDFDWGGKQIVRRGVVDPSVGHLFPPGRKGFPFSEWPAGLPIIIANQGRGVEVRWTDTYASIAGPEFMVDTMNVLKRYGKLEDVRVVFWFD